MIRSQLEEMLAESLLAKEDMDQLVAGLEPLAGLSDRIPAPSAELGRLFGAEAPGDTWGLERGAAAQRPGRRGRGTVAGVVVLALSGVGATGLSAAANTLPGPWQHQVSEFSHRYLPFDFPNPSVRPTPRRHGDVREPRLDHTREESGSAPREADEVHGAPSWRGPEPDGETRRNRTRYVRPLPPGPRPVDATSRPLVEPRSGQDDAGEQGTHENLETRGHPGSPGSPGSSVSSVSLDKDKHAGPEDRPVKGKSTGSPKDPKKDKSRKGDDRKDTGQDRSDDVGPERGREESRPDWPEGGQQHPGDSDPDPANDPSPPPEPDGHHDRVPDRVPDWVPGWEPDLPLPDGDAPRT